MDEELKKRLAKDPDGLLTYEYIANHIGLCDDIMPGLIDNLVNVDQNGQFAVSAARYLSAINHEHYSTLIDRLVEAAIDKDRERRYIGDLLQSLWGSDYLERATELSACDNNFRRIFKRVYPQGSL